MTRQETKKETKTKAIKKVATKAVETAPVKEAQSSSKEITRLVVEVPTESVRSFKILCDLLGTTQGNLVSKALDKYVSDNKELVDQFISLRTQVGKSFQ